MKEANALSEEDANTDFIHDYKQLALSPPLCLMGIQSKYKDLGLSCLLLNYLTDKNA